MPILLNQAKLSVKDENGNYIGINTITERTTAEQIEDINSAADERKAEMREIRDNMDEAAQGYLNTMFVGTTQNLPQFIDHAIEISQNQPNSSMNKLWIKDGDITEISIPKMEDINNIIAPAYTEGPYNIGDYCIQEGCLYKCKTAITSGETWTQGHWTRVDVGGEVSDLKSAIDASDVVPIKFTDAQNGFMGNDGTWANVNSGYKTAFVPVSEGDTVIISPGSQTAYVGVLTNVPTIVAGEQIPYVSDTGLSGKLTVSSGSSKCIVVPSGAACIAVTTLFNGSSDYAPSSMLVNGTEIAKPVWDSIKYIANSGNNSELEQIGFTDNAYINVPVIGETGTITPTSSSTHKYLVSRCRPGDEYILTAKARTTSVVFAVLDLNYKVLVRSIVNDEVVGAHIPIYNDGYFVSSSDISYAASCYKAHGTVDNVLNNNAAVDMLYDLVNGYVYTPLAWDVGAWTGTAGDAIRPFNSTKRRRTAGDIMVRFPLKVTTDGTYLYNLFTLDNNNIILSSTGYIKTPTVVPANTKFRVSISRPIEGGDADIDEDTEDAINAGVVIGSTQLVPPDPGVKWCVMGDSIVQMYYSYYDDNDVGHSGADRTKVWTYLVSQANGWEMTNLAIGGTGYIDPGNNVSDDHQTAYYIARHTDYTPYNLVTLSYGINDWKGNRPVGTLSDDPTATTPTTVLQSMMATIEAIMASNPNCKIVVTTPLNCVGFDKNFGTKDTGYALGYSFSNSGTLESFVQALISVCNKYGIQYIDMTHYSPINICNMMSAVPDGVHPSIEIHKLLAKELAKKITFGK